MKDNNLRHLIIDTVRSYSSNGLGVGTSGNLSARSGECLLITPSGIPYKEMQPEDIVELDLEGRLISGSRQPSSEWRIHTAVYRNREDAGSVVHVHSPYATAVACTRREIPAFHYMVAYTGSNSIRCAEYATFGTADLAANALEALAGSRACLLANHGVLTMGEDIRSAFELALEVEMLARQYHLSMQLGGPVLLDRAEMQVNLEKFRTYGRRRTGD